MYWTWTLQNHPHPPGTSVLLVYDRPDECPYPNPIQPNRRDAVFIRVDECARRSVFSNQSRNRSLAKHIGQHLEGHFTFPLNHAGKLEAFTLKMFALAIAFKPHRATFGAPLLT